MLFYLSSITSPLCNVCAEMTNEVDKSVFKLDGFNDEKESKVQESEGIQNSTISEI